MIVIRRLADGAWLLGEERIYLDKMKERASVTNPVTGNPDYFVLLTDAISTFRGNTPKVGMKQSQNEVFGKNSEYWETRIIGVEAYCGPISTIFFYTVDDMQCGGANGMVSSLK